MTFLPISSEDGLDPQPWYSLRDELVPYIGERAVNLFSYAISDEYGCLVCAVSFRRLLVDRGEDPDSPQVTEVEQLLIDWGRLIARDPAAIPDEMALRLEHAFHRELRVSLIAFAALTVALSAVAMLRRIPLAPELHAYRRAGDLRVAG